MRNINRKHQRDKFFEFIRKAQQKANLAPEEAFRLAAEAEAASKKERPGRQRLTEFLEQVHRKTPDVT
jgi:hypothetical protein